MIYTDRKSCCKLTYQFESMSKWEHYTTELTLKALSRIAQGVQWIIGIIATGF